MCAACWVKQKERVTLRSSSYALRLLVARSWGRLATRVFEWWVRRANPSRVKWKLKPLLKYWQYRLLPGQLIILAFLAPLTLFLVVTSQICPPPSMSEKLFFKSVYFCFYVLLVVNSSPNARSWLRTEKWPKRHRYRYWYTNSNTNTGKD